MTRFCNYILVGIVLIAITLYLKRLGRKNIRKRMIPIITPILLSSSFINFKYNLFRLINYRNGRKDRILTYYHDVYDPHSIAMLHVLPLILQHYSIEIKPKLVTNSSIKVFGPKSNKFNIIDASIQAQYYEIPIKLPLSDDHVDDKKNKDKLSNLSNSILAKYIKNDIEIEQFIKTALKISNILWDNNMTLNEKYILLKKQNYAQNEYLLNETETNKIIKNCMNELNSNKHYLSGNIYFNSEWFPRIDRLLFLFKRLKPYKKNKNIDIMSINNDIIKFKNPFIIPSKLQCNELNFFFSFRSPYGYLVLDRVYKMVKENNLKLNILPVVPAIFRNVTITPSKTWYIPFDCKRIAIYLNIPFGKIFDVGIDFKLIELCLKLFLYSKSKKKEKEYTLEIAKAIWAKGINIENKHNLNKILKKSHLNLNEYIQDYEPNYLNNNQHLKMAENNLKHLYETGNWGIPSFQFKSRCVWGQDRLWALSKTHVNVFPYIDTAQQ